MVPAMKTAGAFLIHAAALSIWGSSLLLLSPALAAIPGTVVAWGDNGFGQTTVPAGLSGVSAIAAGYYHTVALVGTGAPAPTVAAVFSADNLTLVWPNTATGYRVESTLSLLPPVLWGTETGSFQTGVGTVGMVLPVTGTKKFYRLAKP